MASWGASRGNQLGYRIFMVLLRTAGISPAYALLRLVTIYYFLFPGKAGKTLFSKTTRLFLPPYTLSDLSEF